MKAQSITPFDNGVYCLFTSKETLASYLMVYSKSDGKTGERRIECNFDDPLALKSEEFQIAFNLKYLLDGLKMFETKIIKISMNELLMPVILMGVDSDVDLMYLCMPVQLRN